MSSAAASQNSPTETSEQTMQPVPAPPPADTENRIADAESLYSPSTTSTKTSFSSRFGSFSKLPLITRSRPGTSSSAGSSTSSDTTLRTASSKSRTNSDKHGLLGAVFRKSKAERDAKGKSQQQHPQGTNEPSEQQQQKVRDPVKTVPSGKPPAVTFADLAYRYGGPGGSGPRRL